jgi:hypothetical protein
MLSNSLVYPYAVVLYYVHRVNNGVVCWF